MKTYTASETAKELDIDQSRVLQLCRAGRLGYTHPKHGKAWVITDCEIARYRSLGPRHAGRPPNPDPEPEPEPVETPETPVNFHEPPAT